MHKMVKKRLVILLALTCCLLAGCSFAARFGLWEGADSSSESAPGQLPREEVTPEYPVTAAGVTLESSPGAVVSLAQSLTEKLYELGIGDRLVGVDDYCSYPAEAASLPGCGTALLPDMDKILELDPHLVLTEITLSEDDLAILAEREIAVAVIPHAASLRALLGNYKDLALLMEGQVTGAEIGEGLEKRFYTRLEGIAAAVDTVAGEEPVPALYLRLLDFTVATGDTLEGELMKAVGFANVAADYTGWKYPADIAIAAGRPDFEAVRVIFCDQQDITIKDLEQNTFYKSLPAVLKDWYFYVDARLFEVQSLRMLSELERMTWYVYPELAPAGASGGEQAGEEQAGRGADPEPAPASV